MHAGSGLSVPYISASLSMHGSGSLCGGQLRLSEVTLPQAALRVGLAQQDGNSVSLSNQHDAGAICALCDAQVFCTCLRNSRSCFCLREAKSHHLGSSDNAARRLSACILSGGPAGW